MVQNEAKVVEQKEPKTWGLSEIDGETAYPIFSFTAKWAQKIKDGKEEYYKNGWVEGLPPGWMWNSTGIDMMYKELVTENYLNKEMDKLWENVLKNQKERDPEFTCDDIRLSYEYLRNETWCSSWFNHYTFDVGQDDMEAVRSFEKYVSRMKCLNERLRDEQDIFSDSTPKGGICLMGAEDRYRWSGEGGSLPPCRCEGCKKNGLIRINH